MLDQENDALASRVAALQTPEEIERVARQQYGMVRPGEQAYSVLPAPARTSLPAGWPYTVLSGILAAEASRRRWRRRPRRPRRSAVKPPSKPAKQAAPPRRPPAGGHGAQPAPTTNPAAQAGADHAPARSLSEPTTAPKPGHG